ncbi:MAG: SAM-dependent methyltransferase [Magnetovibrio sp.]|jgi:FKBP-type peptidyl-prolyl cis-trans isomerase 2|nr:SAM-dependent methyltransferase [Magnetovibrio sp.]|tara:strand:+ start:2083 stop:3312 length:1230 start_codon:yes stop_codon:yes gene_type:complete
MDPKKRYALKVTQSSLIEARGSLQWRDRGVEHCDTCHLPKLNLWRDLLPPGLGQRLLGAEVGEIIEMDFAPGTLIANHDPGKVFHVHSSQFDFAEMDPLKEPRVGLFYRLGCLQGMSGIFRSDLRPFRIIGREAEGFRIDCNHPLAGRKLRLELRLESIRVSRQERGGQCIDLASKLGEGGPGMQAGLQAVKTEFDLEEPFSRKDEELDLNFYEKPRLIPHLDRRAQTELEELYFKLLKNRNRVLDLMSSWQSHLSPEYEPTRVVGLGMNREELHLNPRLDQYLVHDLNREPELPFDDRSFDAVLCSLSIEYLVHPVEVLREAGRVLVKGGILMVSFSNRWFPSKVIKIWKELQPFERIGLVLNWLEETGGFESMQSFSLRELNRPEDDRHSEVSPFSDPIFAICVHKT